MQDLIKMIINRSNIVSYLEQPILDEDLDKIVLAARSMPSFLNAQRTTVIIIKDEVRKQKIAHMFSDENNVIVSSPVFLLFIADAYKSALACKKADSRLSPNNNLSLLLRSSFETGMSVGGAILAAESLGYGTNVLEAIASDLSEISELLNLPESTVPLLGLTIGYPKDVPEPSVLMNVSAFAHEEIYNKDAMLDYINEYDNILSSTSKETDKLSSNGETWCESMVNSSLNLSKNEETSKLKDFLEKQSFSIFK